MAPRWRGFRHVLHSTAPPDVVFGLLADGGRWSEWAKPLVLQSSWEREGDPAPGGVGAVRKLGGGPVFVRERITGYEPPTRMTYTIDSGIPLVREYKAVVKLSPDGSGTRIEWAGALTTVIPVVADVLAPLLGLSVRALAQRAAAHAGNLVSPRS